MIPNIDIFRIAGHIWYITRHFSRWTSQAREMAPTRLDIWRGSTTVFAGCDAMACSPCLSAPNKGPVLGGSAPKRPTGAAGP